MSRKEYSDHFYEQIYLVLADYSWEVFRECGFSDFFVWGDYVRKHLEVGNPTPVKKYIHQMVLTSDKFLGFDHEESEVFVMRFFILEKYREYYEHIRLFRNLYGGYIIKKRIKIN